MPKAASNREVFINCPFDDQYKPLFYAAIFAILRSGFVPRSALEEDNAGQNRFDKICKIIGECRLGVHDISRVELSGNPRLPRFNMPLELGLFLGACKFGGKKQKTKSCIVFERKEHLFRQYISDISGQDVKAHRGRHSELIKKLATWLRTQGRAPDVPGGAAIANEYSRFTDALPEICQESRLRPDELTFGDLVEIISNYIRARLIPLP